MEYEGSYLITKNFTIEEEVLISGASLLKELESSQETVAFEVSTAGVSRSIYVLEEIAGSSGSEMADRLAVSSLETTISKLNIVNTSHRNLTPKSMTSGVLKNEGLI